MKEQLIKTKIDFYLKKWVDIELNKLPGQIETEMSDPNQDKQEEWRIWFPIDSKVTQVKLKKSKVELHTNYLTTIKLF